MERFNLKKLNELEGKEKYHAEFSDGFAALEDLVAQVEIISAWKINGENTKISAKESLRKHKPWFDERCLELLDQRKQDKLQWFQDPSEINGDNLNSTSG
jgi:hypothetical protein